MTSRKHAHSIDGFGGEGRESNDENNNENKTVSNKPENSGNVLTRIEERKRASGLIRSRVGALVTIV